jgi:hypothetical protein
MDKSSDSKARSAKINRARRAHTAHNGRENLGALGHYALRAEVFPTIVGCVSTSRFQRLFLALMGGRQTWNGRKGSDRIAKDYSRSLPKVRDPSAAIRVSVGR